MDYKSLAKFTVYFLILLTIILLVWLLVHDSGISLKDIFSTKINTQASLLNEDVSFGTQILKPTRDWSVEDLKINAESAIVVETNLPNSDKVLFKKNENEQLPIASLTKLMTALVVLENYDINQITSVSSEAVLQQGGQGLLNAGERLSVNNLLYIMLVESSNDAAYSLAEIKGVEEFLGLMGLEAEKLGLSSTNFADVMGLSPDNRSTAEDLVKITKYISEKYPQIWEILSLDKYRLYTSQGFHHELLSTNELLGKIPDIVGGKTGLTPEAKGCILLLLKNEKDKNYIIYVVLGSDDRFVEMQNLISWVDRTYRW
jgi:D-alanyl-D-alanine carboxypeptidase